MSEQESIKILITDLIRTLRVVFLYTKIKEAKVLDTHQK